MSMLPPSIHIGLAIEKKLQELKISKTEFGRRIGIPQQNVNRILEKESIDTNKLIQISAALEFNFFTLYCDESKIVASNHSAVALHAPATTIDFGNMGTSGSPQIEQLESKIRYLETMIADKDKIIALYERDVK